MGNSLDFVLMVVYAKLGLLHSLVEMY